MGEDERRMKIGIRGDRVGISPYTVDVLFVNRLENGMGNAEW
jgi:hypothetical protein